MQAEILVHKEEQSLPKELREGGCQEASTCGHNASEDAESTCSGFGPFRKIGIEEAGGSSSWQKEHNFFVFVHLALSLKLRVFVDDITALVKGRNKDVAEMTNK